MKFGRRICITLCLIITTVLGCASDTNPIARPDKAPRVPVNQLSQQLSGQTPP